MPAHHSPTIGNSGSDSGGDRIDFLCQDQCIVGFRVARAEAAIGVTHWPRENRTKRRCEGPKQDATLRNGKQLESSSRLKELGADARNMHAVCSCIFFIDECRSHVDKKDPRALPAETDVPETAGVRACRIMPNYISGSIRAWIVSSQPA